MYLYYFYCFFGRLFSGNSQPLTETIGQPWHFNQKSIERIEIITIKLPPSIYTICKYFSFSLTWLSLSLYLSPWTLALISQRTDMNLFGHATIKRRLVVTTFHLIAWWMWRRLRQHAIFLFCLVLLLINQTLYCKYYFNKSGINSGDEMAINHHQDRGRTKKKTDEDLCALSDEDNCRPWHEPLLTSRGPGKFHTVSSHFHVFRCLMATR